MYIMHIPHGIHGENETESVYVICCQTCSVALELVHVLVDLNCEDVLLELVLK